DASREFLLVHSALQRCSILNSRVLSSNGGVASAQAEVAWDIQFGELAGLSSALRDAALLSDGLIGSRSLGSGAWRAWCNMLSHRLASHAVHNKLIRHAESEGDRFLPEPLAALAANKGFLTAEHAELAMVLPRFGRILKWLAVVGRMLESDEPLKPALLIFARVNEQIFELTSYINNRLERFENEEAEIFSSLDAASYTASIELKKVYSQELSGVARMRPSPSIYARMETAHSLLNEGFQQMLAGFARLIDPETDIVRLFPNFAAKLEQSLALRQELWKVVNLVQAAENDPEERKIDAMQDALRDFMKGSVQHLFYKDTETVERFVEEILVTKLNKDLVPILHRFGAYLETLFGQVNLRSVLEKHPFQAN
ncbi:MAG: hypothetical protein AB7J13_01890, partial [Pyrinomonadaceae bacterium]